MRCAYCGSNKHTIKNCPKTWSGSVNHFHMRCAYCGAKDHEIEACYKTWSGNAARARNPKSVADHFVLDKEKK